MLSILSQFHDMSRMKSSLFPCLEANVVLHGEVISQVTYCLTAPVIVRHDLEVASLEYLKGLQPGPVRSLMSATGLIILHVNRIIIERFNNETEHSELLIRFCIFGKQIVLWPSRFSFI